MEENRMLTLPDSEMTTVDLGGGGQAGVTAVFLACFCMSKWRC